MNLADLISPGQGDTIIHFVDEHRSVTLGELWNSCRSFAAWYQVQRTATIGMVLDNSLACVTALIGAAACGATIASLPPLPRNPDLSWYARYLSRVCREVGCTAILVNGSVECRYPDITEAVLAPYEIALSCIGPGTFNPDQFRLVQFTSGSASDPRSDN